MYELFQNKNFRRLWASLVVLALGDALMQMALLELFRLHGYDTRVETAKMLFAVSVPGFLFGPLAMAYLDRWQRRSVLVWSDAFRAFVAVGIVVWLWPLMTGKVAAQHLFEVYALIFVIGTVAAFYLPARAALVPNVTPPEKLMQANTVFMSSIAVAAIGGRALGGFVAEKIGPMAGMIANVVAYVLSVWWLSRIKMTNHATSQDAGGRRLGAWMELRTGMEYLWKHRIAWRLVWMSGTFAFVGGLLLVEIVGYAMKTLHLGTGGVGYLLGAAGVGAGVGLGICAKGPAWVKADWLTPVQLAIVGVALLAMGFTEQVWVAVILVLFIGASASMAAIHVDAKLQENVEETRRGSVFAARGMLTSLTMIVAFWLQFGTAVLKQTPAPRVMVWLGGATVVMGLLALGAMRGRKSA